jgi:hypothetical protein
MTEHSENDIQRQAHRILTRWLKIEENITLALKGIYFTLMVVFVFQNAKENLLRAVLTLIGIAILSQFLFVRMRSWAIKRYARRLSVEEGLALRNAVIDGRIDDQKTAQEILTRLGKLPLHQQLLRASSSTHNDSTLLRAATESNDIPNKELLRASHISEPEQRDMETNHLTVR